MSRAVPARPPETWLDLSAAGNVLSFVDTQICAGLLDTHVAALVAGVQRIEVQPVALRSIFTALARATRDGRKI